MSTLDYANGALDAPLDVLVKLVPSIGDESIDSDHLGTAADQPVTGDDSLMARLNLVVSTPVLPGSLRGVLPDELYVFALGTDPGRPIRLGRISWRNKCHVVTDRFKRLLEALPGKRSEFYPVSVVYRDPRGTTELGGGDVVRDGHWLWYCYAVHDMIDVAASRAVFHPTSELRLDRPDHPRIDFNVVGNMPADGPPSLVLKSVPYAEDAAFHVLGKWSPTPFVSPDLVRVLHEEALHFPADVPLTSPTPLDLSRYFLTREAVGAGKLAHKPPFRIAGTDWIVRDEYDPPFYPERPSFAGF